MSVFIRFSSIFYSSHNPYVFNIITASNNQLARYFQKYPTIDKKESAKSLQSLAFRLILFL